MSEMEMIITASIKAYESFGVKIMQVTDESVYIEVPGHSDQLDAHGNEMAGSLLAKRIQKHIDALTGGRKITVFHTIASPFREPTPDQKTDAEYYPVYKCPLCGATIKADGSRRIPYDDLPALCGQIVRLQQVAHNPYLADGIPLMNIPHKCPDGGCGLAQFAGFLRA